MRLASGCSPPTPTTPPAAPLLRPRGCRSRLRRRASITPPPCGERCRRRASRCSLPLSGGNSPAGRRRKAAAPPSPPTRRLPAMRRAAAPPPAARHRGPRRDTAVAAPRGGGRTPRGAPRCRGMRLRLHGGRSRDPARRRGAGGRWLSPGLTAELGRRCRSGGGGGSRLFQLPSEGPRPTAPRFVSETSRAAGRAVNTCSALAVPPFPHVTCILLQNLSGNDRSVCLLKGKQPLPFLVEAVDRKT